MAIFPFQTEGQLYAKVLEEEREIYVALSPIRIIENSCKFYCSSFEGRKQGTKTVTGFTHKPPIVIDQINDIFFFPTASPNNENCIWVSLHYSYEYKSTPSGNTYLMFPNNSTVEFPVSKASFETQVYRTSFVRSKLQQRVSRNRNNNKKNSVGTPRVIYRLRR